MASYHPWLVSPRHTEALFVIFHDCEVIAVSLPTNFVSKEVWGLAHEWKKLHSGVNKVQTALVDLKATIIVLDAMCEGFAVYRLPLQRARWCSLVCTTCFRKELQVTLFCIKKKMGNTLFWWSTLDIILTICNF